MVVGDGELRDQLVASADARALGESAAVASCRRDMVDVWFISDPVVLTSDSEGTPVSLFEAERRAFLWQGPTWAASGRRCRMRRLGFWRDRTMRAASARAVASILGDRG